ncbi:MAG: metalloregulator ArsR/SmtB family transcription factor [Erysipelotrichaceae bacterium]
MEFNTIEVLKALADPTRLAIVKRLHGQCELCACNMIDDFNITQPTLSFHMKKLTACGLVNVRKEGVWMKYSVNTAFIEQLKSEISFTSALSDTEPCCENKV